MPSGGEMENSTVSCSWCCPSSSSSSSSSDHHHLRLLLTLSELNKIVAALLRLMEQEDGETPTRQTEAGACPAKTELQRRVEEFHSSYCSLAGYWGDNFGSKVDDDPSPGPGLRHLRPDHKDGPEDDRQLSVTDDVAGKSKINNSDPEGLPALDVAGSPDRHVSRSQQMSMVAEDVVGELARRHDEKREAYRVLRCQAERMTEEGRLLRLDYERLVSENGALRSKLDSIIAGDGENSRSGARCSSLVKKQRRGRLFFSRLKSLFF